jgi:hypothetical protein
MSDLQTAFYIIGIIFMSLMLILTLVTGLAVLVIRNKIVAIQNDVEARLATVSEWAGRGEAVVGAIKKVSRKNKK